MINESMYSSVRGDWETPPGLFAALDAEFHFTLDAAAVKGTAKVPIYLGPDRPTMLASIDCQWTLHLQMCGVVVREQVAYLNPPYGREIGAFLASARRNVALGWTVVALLPARTDTAWFHDHVLHRAEIRWLRGRVRFVGAAASAPFPSMIVIWRP